MIFCTPAWQPLRSFATHRARKLASPTHSSFPAQVGSLLSPSQVVFLARSYSISSTFSIFRAFTAHKWPLPSLSLLGEQNSTLLVFFSGLSCLCLLDSQRPSLPATKILDRSLTAHPALDWLPSPSLENRNTGLP